MAGRVMKILTGSIWASRSLGSARKTLVNDFCNNLYTSFSGETARALDYLEKAIKLVRTKQEMASLQTFKLILTFQPEINKEMLLCGLDPIELQNSLTKLS